MPALVVVVDDISLQGGLVNGHVTLRVRSGPSGDTEAEGRRDSGINDIDK